MHIHKIKIQNFKKFEASEFEFNSDTNILVGDNQSGKSTLLEAIEICLNCTFHGRPLASELTAEFFNKNTVRQFLTLEDEAKINNGLPEIVIECFLKDAPAELRGTNNTDGANVTGIFVNIKLNPDLEPVYHQLVRSQKVNSIPIEFYIIEWYDFAWNKLNKFTKPIKSLFVEPDRIHPTYGKNKYINTILNESLGNAERSTLNFAFRQIKKQFDEDDDVRAINANLDTENLISTKNLHITTDVKGNSTWENNLHLAVDGVTFAHIGKGEQSQIQIKLALHNNEDSVDVVLVEEPENHLSHMNLTKLISYIEDFHSGKQLFLTTHSSFVLNKLSVDKLCFLGDDFTRLNNIEASSIQKIKRLPGYDTLRITLAKKAILVEGPSDELLIKKLFLDTYEKLPEELGIELIVVNGLGFTNYLNIAKVIGTQTIVVKDNDGSYVEKITNWFQPYRQYVNLTITSSQNDQLNSLEPALIAANGETLAQLDSFASVVLSTRTKAIYDTQETLELKKIYLKEWFQNNGAKKVDSAMRIFESPQNSIIYPGYIREALRLAE